MRYNEYRSAQINGSAAPGYSSDQAMKALEEVFRQTMPNEMGYDYLGMSFQEKKAQQGVSPTVVFGMSLLFVFLILAALYESWSLPFSVLLGTPVAVFGAFAHPVAARDAKQYLCADRLDHAHRSGRQERHPHCRIRQGRIRKRQAAARRRTRRRAFAFAADSDDFLRLHLRMLPFWFASGSGAVARRILGSTVIGGMIAASAIAIFLIPVTFYVIERLFAGRETGREQQEKPPSSESPAPV